MELVRFYGRHLPELLQLVGQHLYLVAISTAVAVAIGVPLGILLTRRPAWRGPVLGLANLFQTIPSLALFGFLIPLPFIGGIGATTALVARAVYPPLPTGRNTSTALPGVAPPPRATRRAAALPTPPLLSLLPFPPA